MDTRRGGAATVANEAIETQQHDADRDDQATARGSGDKSSRCDDLPDAGREACGSGAQWTSGNDESHEERRYQACSGEAS